MPTPVGTRIIIRKPNDFHHHGRDGDYTDSIISCIAQRFYYCLFMPNLKPPITTTSHALQYQHHILQCYYHHHPRTSPTNEATSNQEMVADDGASSSSSLPIPATFKPFMTLYLTEAMKPEEIYEAAKTGVVAAVKYYPAGATTNSEYGVRDIHHCYPVLQAMVESNMMLCIHSEVTYGDIFDREKEFIETILKPLIHDFPTLRITMEHISTKDAVDYIINEAPDHVKASVTCHHLLYNRNDLLVGGLKAHLYCLPILKSYEPHCVALQQAVLSGTTKLFLGTDSAPHPTHHKISECSCAGIYTAHAAIELYAEFFDEHDALDQFEGFACLHGAAHYGFDVQEDHPTITLEKKEWTVPKTYPFGKEHTVTPLRAGGIIPWSIVAD